MAHRQGLNDASANIHRGAVRLGRVLYGALVHAAVRNEQVDLHADDGGHLLVQSMAVNRGETYDRTVRLARRQRVQGRERSLAGLSPLKPAINTYFLTSSAGTAPPNETCEARPGTRRATTGAVMDKARRLAKEAGAAAAEAGARAAHKAKDGARAATEAATAVAVTKAAASKQRAEAIYRGTDGLVDPHLQQKQVALKALSACFAELSRGLRHERHRALESAKGAKETRDALTRIVEANHALRFQLQPAITSEAGLAARWEQLAGAIDAQLLSPVVVQLTAIFAEAEKVYAA